MSLHWRAVNRWLLVVTLASPWALTACDSPTGSTEGFESIFNGSTLAGWEGNPTYWRAENGVLIGETTPGTLLMSNTFVVWHGGRPADFELRLEYRISGEGNSGINYR